MPTGTLQQQTQNTATVEDATGIPPNSPLWNGHSGGTTANRPVQPISQKFVEASQHSPYGIEVYNQSPILGIPFPPNLFSPASTRIPHAAAFTFPPVEWTGNLTAMPHSHLSGPATSYLPAFPNNFASVGNGNTGPISTSEITVTTRDIKSVTNSFNQLNFAQPLSNDSSATTMTPVPRNVDPKFSMQANVTRFICDSNSSAVLGDATNVNMGGVPTNPEQQEKLYQYHEQNNHSYHQQGQQQKNYNSFGNNSMNNITGRTNCRQGSVTNDNQLNSALLPQHQNTEGFPVAGNLYKPESGGGPGGGGYRGSAYGNRTIQNPDANVHYQEGSVKQTDRVNNERDKAIIDKLIEKHNLNPRNFNCNPSEAKFFVLKSYSEDDIHQSFKHNAWCSTQNGNKKLDAAFKSMKGKGPVYLFFSVNASGHFCGLAKMKTFLDYSAQTVMQQPHKWKGRFDMKWIFIKDVPNEKFRHITIESNEGKPVTQCRDSQEVPYEQGKEMLKLMFTHDSKTSMLDSFSEYENRQQNFRPRSSRYTEGFPVAGNLYKPESGGGPGGGGYRGSAYGNRTIQNPDANVHYQEGSVKQTDRVNNERDKAIIDKLIEKHNLNPRNFNCNPSEAKFFVLKSYSEDDIHQSFKHNAWCSTQNGNKKLDAAFKSMKGKGPVYLFFSVNASGHFCGLAKMKTFLDYSAQTVMQQPHKWKGRFDMKWIFIKDVPNEKFRHITIESNEGKPVTQCRDSQEVPYEQGKEMLKLMFTHDSKTSMLDSFSEYENRQQNFRPRSSRYTEGFPVAGNLYKPESGGGPGGGGYRGSAYGNRTIQNPDANVHYQEGSVKQTDRVNNERDKAIIDKLIEKHNLNPRNFNCNPSEAKFFVLKSYSEDDIHQSFKHNAWCSTQNGNKKLDAAFKSMKGKGPVYLFFSVNASGHFCGLAKMKTFLDYSAQTVMQQPHKWKGRFDMKWIFIKDVPNEKFRHITIESNEGKPVTQCRDSQEVPYEQGKEMLKLMFTHDSKTSMLDSFSSTRIANKISDLGHLVTRRVSQLPETCINQRVVADQEVGGIEAVHTATEPSRTLMLMCTTRRVL